MYCLSFYSNISAADFLSMELLHYSALWNVGDATLFIATVCHATLSWKRPPQNKQHGNDSPKNALETVGSFWVQDQTDTAGGYKHLKQLAASTRWARTIYKCSDQGPPIDGQKIKMCFTGVTSPYLPTCRSSMNNPIVITCDLGPVSLPPNLLGNLESGGEVGSPTLEATSFPKSNIQWSFLVPLIGGR